MSYSIYHNLTIFIKTTAQGYGQKQCPFLVILLKLWHRKCILNNILKKRGKKILLKWPNDFYIKNRKIGGAITSTNKELLFCGIGLNLIEVDENFGKLDINIDIDEILNFVSNPSTGGSCESSEPLSNNPPTVDSGNNYTIPSNTPFNLTASGNDADDDPITYTW